MIGGDALRLIRLFRWTRELSLLPRRKHRNGLLQMKAYVDGTGSLAARVLTITVYRVPGNLSVISKTAYIGGGLLHSPISRLLQL